MDEKWRVDFVALLKHFERNSPSGQHIHEFRRSFESGNVRKTSKVKGQLQQIYEKCKDKLGEKDFQDWFNQGKFELSVGLKKITLECVDENYLKWVFSEFDSDLDQRTQSKVVVNGQRMNLPVSGKQLRTAMRKINKMDSTKLNNMIDRIPQSQLNSLGNSAMIESLQNDSRAQVIAEKIKLAREK